MKGEQILPVAIKGTAVAEGSNRSAIGAGVNLNINEDVRRVSQSMEQEHPEYAERFKKYFMTGSLVEEGELRTLSSTGQGGGAVIPVNMLDRIIPMLANAAALRNVASVHTGGRVDKVAVESKLAGGQVTQEGAKINIDVNNVFENRTLDYVKFTYGVPYTMEWKEDALGSLDVEGSILRRAANVLATKEEATHLDMTSGIASKVQTIKEIPDATKFNTDALIQMQDMLPVPFRKNTCWVMSSEALTAIRLMKDTIGRTMYDSTLELAPRQSLLGAPLYVTAGLPGFGAGKISILYGDFSYVMLMVARQFTLQVNMKAENDIKEYFFSMRSAAVLTQEDAMVALKTKA